MGQLILCERRGPGSPFHVALCQPVSGLISRNGTPEPIGLGRCGLVGAGRDRADPQLVATISPDSPSTMPYP